MAKKDENVLGLPSVSASSDLGGNGSLITFNPGRALTRDERRVIEEWHKERLVIEVTGAKTIFGMEKIGELHHHASLTFDETVGNILTVKEQPRGKEHQTYVDAFTTRQVQMLGQHMLGALEVGATNIGVEIHRSLYPPPEEPEPRSLWKRLFG